MRGAAALSFPSCGCLCGAQKEQSQTKEEERRKRGERGASDATPHSVPVPGCSSRARCSLEPLNHSEAAAEAAQLCFSTRRYTAVAEASPGASTALRGIKQGAYSWQNRNYFSLKSKSRCQSIPERDRTAWVSSLEAQPTDLPGALFLISARHLHADTWINNGLSFQGHTRLLLLCQGMTTPASKRGVEKATKHHSELPASSKAEEKMTLFVIRLLVYHNAQNCPDTEMGSLDKSS